jgi:OFA family oxalate/formate antiporter-like MFS transporter
MTTLTPPQLKTVARPSSLLGRWSYVGIGFVMNLCLGTVYAWSVFRPALQAAPYSLTSAESMLPFSVFLLCFGITFSVSGIAVSRYGPRRPALIGALLVGAGYSVSSLISSMPGSALVILILGFGAMAGTGCAFAYNPPISVSGRWFPDKRGLALGLTVMGFGLSSLFTAPLVASLIKTVGISQTFIFSGAAFLAVLLALGSTLRFPSEEWRAPAGAKKPTATSQSELTTRMMIRTPTFYITWAIYLIGAGVGLSVIGYTKQIALQVTGLPDVTATLMVSVLAVANALGRPAFGRVIDSIGPKKTLMMTIGLQLVSLAVLMPLASNFAFLLVGIVLLGATFGSYLAVVPSAISYMYGTKNLGPNYGVTFSAYGFGGVLMPMIVSQLLGKGPTYTVASYSLVFYTMSALVGVAFVLSLFIGGKKREA